MINNLLFIINNNNTISMQEYNIPYIRILKWHLRIMKKLLLYFCDFWIEESSTCTFEDENSTEDFRQGMKTPRHYCTIISYLAFEGW